MASASTPAAPGPVVAAPMTAADVHIGPDRMLRIHGYADLERVRRPIRAAAERTARLAESLVRPAARYRRLPVEGCTDGRLVLAGGGTLRSHAFSRFLVECREVAVFVLTAGGDLDGEIERLTREDQLLDVLFLETAGWLAVEAITKAFTGHLRARARDDGLRLTRRMGPGYVYRTDAGEAAWPLEDQRALFDLLDGDDLPVTMLESCAMLPKMSRSGLVGLAPSRTATTEDPLP